MAIYTGELISGPIPYAHRAGQIVAVYSVFEAATALALNDTIEMCIKPIGLRVIDCVLVTDDLDTGTALVLDVGFKGGDTAAFIDGSTIGQAGGMERMTNAAGLILADSVAVDAEQTVQILAQVGPTGGGLGTIKLITYMTAKQTYE